MLFPPLPEAEGGKSPGAEGARCSFPGEQMLSAGQLGWLFRACLCAALFLQPAPMAHGQPVAANWNQFRGPDGAGVAENANIPAHFGPDTNTIWKVAIPPGHSSPVIWNDQIFLTASEDGRTLVTIAVNRTDGHILWQ